MFNVFLNLRARGDLFSSIVALASGLFILISMIGTIAR